MQICKYFDLLGSKSLHCARVHTSLNREPLQACTRDNNIIISYYATIIKKYKDWQRNKGPEARKMTVRH